MSGRFPTTTSVIIVGAGIAGIAAGKVLAENGVTDFVILEACNRIGGRLLKQEFEGVTVEAGAGWITGVGGTELNPMWELAVRHGLRTCFSDYSSAPLNIYDPANHQGRVPRSVAEAAYDLAVETANTELEIEATSMVMAMGQHQLQQQKLKQKRQSCIDKEAQTCANKGVSSPVELALDYMLHDFEMAEVEPIPTYTDYGAKEFMVADDRGFEYLLHKIAQEYLRYDGITPVDPRLKLQKVVREIEYTNERVRMETEDGSVYTAKYAIVTASLGVLRSDLINFIPELPRWKRESFHRCEYRIYTKIFLKFPSVFWPTGDATEFFLYAHSRRGYYTFWQHMENAYPGSKMLVVTVTDEESKRIELQEDEQTRAEAMAVLRSMFGDHIPEAERILVPRWWCDRFQRGSYTNYPVLTDPQHFRDIQAPVGALFFSGEHTSERFNGYVHGGYHSGVDTARRVMKQLRKTETSPPRFCNCNCGATAAVPRSCSCHHILRSPGDVVSSC